MISSLDVKDKENEVRILELEVQKHELENRLAQLKSEDSGDEGLKATIKQQNQTLLRISAELEAIKQCDPFNSVFIAYSVENISNMIETLTEQSIDGGCIGCAGPCKVVDVAAKLQKELDSTIGQLVDSRKRCDYLSTKITEKRGMYDELDRTCGDLRAELYDLRTHLPDNFWAVVTEKDSMIRRQGKVIEDFKAIETKETDRLHKIILDMDVTISDLMDNDRKMNGFLDEYRATVDNRDKTIEELKDSNIEDLKELYDFHEGELEWFKDVISTRDLSIKALTIMCQSSGSIRNDLTSTIGEKDKMLEKYRCEIVGLRDMHDVVWDKVHALEAELVISKGVVTAKDIHIAGLKAELSARKDDSAVLMEVVEIIKDDTIPNSKVPCVIFNLVKDYLDAPEGPPETPIDDLYKVTVAYTFLELP